MEEFCPARPCLAGARKGAKVAKGNLKRPRLNLSPKSTTRNTTLECLGFGGQCRCQVPGTPIDRTLGYRFKGFRATT